LWRCFSCGGAGDIYQFYQEIHKVGFNESKAEIEGLSKPPIPWEDIYRYEQILKNAPKRLEFLKSRRGLIDETLAKYHIGHDADRYIIPIMDHTGSVINIRRYDPQDKGSTKVINLKGRGMLRLFPWENIAHDKIVLVGGEMDCLLTNQMGLPTMTTTNGEMAWSTSWDRLFQGKEVWICYDKDATGRKGALKIARRLVKVAKEVKIVELPIGEGEDITNYFVDHGYSKEDLLALIKSTKVFKPKDNEEDEVDGTIYSMHLSQASKGEYYNKKVKFNCVVAGKDLAPFMFPQEINLVCNTDSGDKCATCGMGMAGGKKTVAFKDSDPGILRMIGVPDHMQKSFIKSRAGAYYKCSQIKMDIVKSGNVEEIILIPEIDFSAQEQEYVARRCFHVGHGLKTNQSYEMYAVTVPHPFNQQVTHLIYEAKPAQDNISAFKMTPELYDNLKNMFQTDNIIAKLDDIYEDLTYNVTKIYGREDIMTAVDLTYHSCINFYFQDKWVTRGWMECLIIGDPRSGKTETAQMMIKHYKLGEFITGENSSFAGLIGGMQQHGSKKWTVTWGKIPLNDRRIVIIDEVSGLSEDAIGNMSGVRSSGVAEIVKIQTERTSSRTRIIWMSNPRAARTINTYSFGVQAVRELIGRPEDIARFDFAVTSASDEVPADVINAISHKKVLHKYTGRLCRQLILWAWSRKPEHITFTQGSVKAILDNAMEMGKIYTSQIPLVEVADQRIKLARLSVAIACRVFSTDDGERVIVKEDHVKYARRFLEQCYRKDSMAYYDFSRVQKRDDEIIDSNRDEIEKFVKENYETLGVFLQYNTVRPRDLEEMLGMDRDEVRHIVNFLVRNQLVQKSQYGLIKRPHFIKILKGTRPNEKKEGEY
jgi:hypothetical protein